MKQLITLLLMALVSLSLPAQTIEQIEKELIKQKVPHHKIVLAQARLETGNFTSRGCKVHHNLFGIKHNGKYARYKTWQDSIKDYKERISSRYKGGNYLVFLKRIGYAEEKEYTKKINRIVNTSKTK